MVRACTVCSHPDRAGIDEALVAANQPLRDIAGRFGLSKSALFRHRDHLASALVERKAADEVRQALDVVAQLRAINGVTMNILTEARKRGDPETALRAVDRLHRQIELQAKLLGELDERPQINVVLSAEWLRIRAVIVESLAAYPEARLAVAERLASVEASP